MNHSGNDDKKIPWDGRIKYIYRGDDGESIPENVRIVKYIDNIKKIKKKSARGCQYLTSVIHPDSVIDIEDGAYQGCESVTNLHLSSSLERIGALSFYSCVSITMLELPSDLHTITRAGFAGCSALWAIISQNENEPLSLKIIGHCAFHGCLLLTSIPYLPFLETIGACAFFGCVNLTEVTLGPSLTSAARSSFDGCTSLVILRCIYHTYSILPWAATHVIIGSDTTHIHNSAFAGCDRLHTIDLIPTVTSIGASSFWGCKALPANFAVSRTVKFVGIGAFARCEINFTNLPPHAMQDVYTHMGGTGESAPHGITRVVVHETVKEINDTSIVGCSSLTYLDIQSKSITIKRCAFSRCRKLQEIHFQESANINIESCAFSNCLRLKTVIWPKVVEWIIEGTFGINTSPGHRPPTPIIHESSFDKYPPAIVEDCKRYSQIFRLWEWIGNKEVRHKKGETQKEGNENACQNSNYSLCEKDLCVLKQVDKIIPPPPKDLNDAILNYLHSYEYFLCKIPRDLIWKVIEYIP